MALSMKDVRKANEEFYSNKYIDIIPKIYCFLISFCAIIIFQVLIFLIKIDMVKSIYYQKANLEFLGEVEVLDWIKQNTDRHFLDLGTWIIAISSIIICGLIIYWYWFGGYQIYKHKKKNLKYFLSITFIEFTSLFFYYAYLGTGTNSIFFILIVSLFLAINLVTGFFMPLELKVPVKFDKNHIEKIFSFLNFIINIILKKF